MNASTLLHGRCHARYPLFQRSSSPGFSLLARSLLISALLACPFLSRAATYSVSSYEDVEDYLTGDGVPQAVAGDILEWVDGTYHNQTVVLAGVDEITLKAETPGGVIFTGESYIWLGSDDSTVSGFEIQVPDYYEAQDPLSEADRSTVLAFRSSSSDHAYGSRISNCRIVDNYDKTNSVPEGEDSYMNAQVWVMFFGIGNQLEHCSFEGKATWKPLVVVRFDNAGDGGHIIKNNYFADRPLAHSHDSNGWEIIRIGDSNSVCEDSEIVVMDNLFERCDGEVETISNKTNANFFISNTFRDTEGQISIRQGLNCLIEGNYFIGTENSRESGVRLTGEGHVVVNNYFEGIHGSGGRATISLVMGYSAWVDGCSGVSDYRPVDNVLLAHNTMVNCKRPFEFGAYSKSYNHEPPSNVKVYNNAVYSDSTQAILTYSDAGSGVSYSGNVFFHDDGAGMLFSGVSPSYTSTEIDFDDPDFVYDSGYGIYRPDSASPVNGAAQAVVAEAGADILGNLRPASGRDAGAEEKWGATQTSANYHPLVASDVGCTWGPNAGPGPSSPQTVVLNPVHDAFVRDGVHADTNFGGGYYMGNLYVELSGVDHSKRAYLMYDLSSITGTVTSATFRIKIESLDPGVKNSLRPVSDDTWDEYGLTWNNKPGYGSSMGTITLTTAGAWAEWDVSTYIDTEASGDGLASFCVLPHSLSLYEDAYYYSAEAASGNRPELVVTFE
ncbi:chondroitinase-B domain-containing protein [Cerasicoccus fimbriatus]|uniref:chondroitinase-B domain-containing protein n=1 Tax=Cerasicoccus fimbriatus TaxID=3014554 RepID=UPI0022B5CF14|nr:chondroitinase-B domain-containing protein [Cerasicoccus sp. TK19100]